MIQVRSLAVRSRTRSLVRHGLLTIALSVSAIVMSLMTKSSIILGQGVTHGLGWLIIVTHTVIRTKTLHDEPVLDFLGTKAGFGGMVVACFIVPLVVKSMPVLFLLTMLFLTSFALNFKRATVRYA